MAGQNGWTVVADPTSAWKPVAQPPARPAGLPDGQELPGFAAHPVSNMEAPLLGQAAPALLQAGEFGKGVGEGALHTISSADKAASKIPVLGNFLTTPIGQAPTKQNSQTAMDTAQELSRPVNTAQKIGRGTEQAAEFLAPTGLEKAGANALGFGGRVLGSAIHSGAINRLQGGNFSTGAVAGGIGTGIARGMEAAAPALAETAMRVRGNDRLFGRTIGDAILNDTKGVFPSSVADSARAKVSELTPEIERLADEAGQNGARGSLAPARDAIGKTINTHLGNRAMSSASDLSPLKDSLTTDGLTRLPLAENQTPAGLRAIKQGINSDYISNWKLDQAPGLKASARTAYGRINNEFHNAVPGATELDQRVSSLIPVIKRAEAVDSNAGVLQRTAGRIMAHSGAATMGVGGAYSGYKEGGLPMAIAGGTAGILAPELLSSPTAQMIAARGLNSVLPKVIVPATKGLILQGSARK